MGCGGQKNTLTSEKSPRTACINAAPALRPAVSGRQRVGNREHRGVPAQPPLPQHRPIAAVGLPEPPPCTPKNPAELQVGRIRFLQPCPRGGSGGCGLVVTAMFLFSSPPRHPPACCRGFARPPASPAVTSCSLPLFSKPKISPGLQQGGCQR